MHNKLFDPLCCWLSKYVICRHGNLEKEGRDNFLVLALEVIEVMGHNCCSFPLYFILFLLISIMADRAVILRVVSIMGFEKTFLFLQLIGGRARSHARCCIFRESFSNDK